MGQRLILDSESSKRWGQIFILDFTKNIDVIHKKVGPVIYFEFPPFILPYLQFFSFQRQVLVIN